MRVLHPLAWAPFLSFANRLKTAVSFGLSSSLIMSVQASTSLKSKRVRSNRVVFTLNNPTEEEKKCLLERLTQLSNQSCLIYAIVGSEVAPQTGTPHLQGFVSLKPSFLKANSGTPLRWKSLIPGLARAHLENAYGSDHDSKTYCSKESVLFEIGNPEDPALGGTFGQILKCKSMEEATQLCPETRLKYHFQLKDIFQTNFVQAHSKPSNPVFTLTKWQADACFNLITQTKRSILWIVDEKGGRGKTTLRDFLASRLGSSCFVSTGGKNSDIVHSMVARQQVIKYVIFDYPRNTRPEFYNWKLLEDFKNGDVESGKYNSVVLKFPPMHVIVLGNHPLDSVRDRLSYDRWDVHILGDGTTRDPIIHAPTAFASTDLYPDIPSIQEDLIADIFK